MQAALPLSFRVQRPEITPSVSNDKQFWLGGSPGDTEFEWMSQVDVCLAVLLSATLPCAAAV